MSDNRFYIACLDLTDRPAVVVGAGAIGLEKAEGLLAAGARVTVVAPSGVKEIAALERAGRITWERRPYRSSDLDDVIVVIAATSDRALSERVSRDAEARKLLVNVADVPDLCNFILPSVHRNGTLALAVSTGGASPALAKRMRREAAALFSASYARLARILEDLRPWSKANLDGYDARRDFFEALVNGDPDPIALLDEGAEDELRELIARRQSDALERSGRRQGEPAGIVRSST